MMADEPKYKAVKIVGRHVPDVSVETAQDGTKYNVPLPGVFEYGMMVGKRFVQFGQFQAGNHFNADGSHVEPDDKKQSDDAPDDAQEDGA